MSIAGVSVGPKHRMQNLPNIKSKGQIHKHTSGSVLFDSHFEGGNLLYVYRTPLERQEPFPIESYDLILQNDTNTKGHNQWFYFKVKNLRKNVKVRFNIVNLIKK